MLCAASTAALCAHPVLWVEAWVNDSIHVLQQQQDSTAQNSRNHQAQLQMGANQHCQQTNNRSGRLSLS
jgi:hypothetical protein